MRRKYRDPLGGEGREHREDDPSGAVAKAYHLLVMFMRASRPRSCPVGILHLIGFVSLGQNPRFTQDPESE